MQDMLSLDLLTAVRDFKAVLRATASRQQLPVDRPVEYPALAAELKESHPAIYMAAYVDGEPIDGCLICSLKEWSVRVSQVFTLSCAEGCPYSLPSLAPPHTHNHPPQSINCG